ncbi:DNA starvation/stationary phase protection protein DpsA [Halorussus salinisoli]|uniref:DNA starvation/stationary phase protection protein DpsA n=1 Tax=Halorussus salinisoli TaxID=2558242 RepID=UPI002A91B5C5|nr:DNA starvation/stationary phase protection protein DpsA [Halorussus salinisoli]
MPEIGDFNQARTDLRAGMASHQHVRQQAGTVGGNSVRMDVGKAKHVVEALNIDLAATVVLYHQLRKHYWTITGAHHHGLTSFFRDAADDMRGFADALADRIHTLGGVPSSGPAALEQQSHVPFEGADIYVSQRALANDLQAYGDLIEQVSSHIELAKSYGDHATGEILRYHLVILEEYAHLFSQFLHEDSLTFS